MEITEATVRHLEALAALRLSDVDRERMRVHLARVLDYVRQLEALDVSEVPPTYHVIAAENVVREDRVLPSLPREDVLRNAPDTRAGMFRVPRFVGE